MVLKSVDWLILIVYLTITLCIGLWVSRRSGKDSTWFFLADRAQPWWLLGVSMVATTFSTDTPNLVADITRSHGVAGNWVWWAFLLTGMMTTFVYAGLWRRSGVVTDLELYELRYSGRAAAFLRGFRAVYLGVFFNVMIMAAVSLAAIKIGGVLFGATPVQTLLVAAVVTVIFATAGGLTGVLFTDLLLFAVAMTGAVVAAVYAVGQPEVGGLSQLFAHPEVSSRLALIPDFQDPATFVPLFLVPIAVQWWAAWYPGSEPGGGGYVAQRMLAARDERHAIGATLFFNLAHYALRPWPWILVALASLVVFPDLDALAAAFPHVDPSVIGHDLAYPAMLTFLPAGLLGLVVGSLAAAFMSTLSSHLNWGSSYLVHDLYHRFMRPQASERELVLLGRGATVVLMALAAVMALALDSALGAFQILLQIGAGTGLLFLLRWFWWRINAWSELAAMVVSFAMALAFQFFETGWQPWQELIAGVGVTTFAWVTVTCVTPATEPSTLREFYRRVRPSGPGWRQVRLEAERAGEPLPVSEDALAAAFAAMFAGCLAVYGALFAGGYGLFGRPLAAILCAAVSAAGLWLLWRLWPGLSRARPPVDPQ